MSVLRRHPLVRADLSEAVNWYEDQQPGLGVELAADFRFHHRQLAQNAQLYAVRFADVRRLNLDRFPYGLFYGIRPPEIWILAISCTPAGIPRLCSPNGGGISVDKAQLLALNQQVPAKIENGEPVTAPGVPENYADARKLVTEDCIKPQHHGD